VVQIGKIMAYLNVWLDKTWCQMGPNRWGYKINSGDIDQNSWATKWTQAFQNMMQIVKCWEWEYQREGV